MYDYSGLAFSKELSSIIGELFFDSDWELLLFLELYKFYSRERLVEFLNRKQAGDFADIQYLKRDAVLAEYEAMYSILINRVSQDTVEVITTVGREPNLPALELALGNSTIQVICVTPLNYLELAGKSLPGFDPLVLFKRLLIEAISLKATDLHFDVKHDTLKPRYVVSVRVNGVLEELPLFELNEDLNKRMICALVERKTASSSLDLSDPAGVVTSSSGLFGTSDVELRISANKVLDGYHYVVRIQTKNTFAFSIEKLGFSPDVVGALKYVSRRRSGITLITGAIRTGKNTTAFAVAREMAKEPIKIVSYESPVEVLMPFTQIDYQEDQKILANAIRLAKKQDVNIAFVNEIPNKEVAFAVRDLVNSSVHVITTMHMDRIWHLPYKLREYYGEGYKDIISQINAVFNQKMFGVSCPHCQRSILVSSVQDAHHRAAMQEQGLTSVRISNGCKRCGETGLTPGANQPYVEFVKFDDDLTSELLKCSSPHEMEAILKERVGEHGLKYSIVNAIGDGKLPIDALDYV